MNIDSTQNIKTGLSGLFIPLHLTVALDGSLESHAYNVAGKSGGKERTT